MKKALIGLGIAVGLLVVWCGFVAVQKNREIGRITSEEMAQFRRYLGLARRELAINSMEETGEMDRLSREFTALARKAQGERAEEFRAYAAYFKEFVDLNRERATAAGIMKDRAFLHLATIRNAADLRGKKEAIERLQTAVTGVSNQVSRLEGFVLNVLKERGIPREEAEQATRHLMDDAANDTRFVLALCRIHTDYAQNVANLFDLLERELGHWAPTRDGTVIFRRPHAVDAAKAISDRLDVIVEEDRALRQQNLNEVASQLYR
jgi:hypothetical protein